MKDCNDKIHKSSALNFKLKGRDAYFTLGKFSKSASLPCEICNPNTSIFGFVSRAI